MQWRKFNALPLCTQKLKRSLCSSSYNPGCSLIMDLAIHIQDLQPDGDLVSSKVLNVLDGHFSSWESLRNYKTFDALVTHTREEATVLQQDVRLQPRMYASLSRALVRTLYRSTRRTSTICVSTPPTAPFVGARRRARALHSNRRITSSLWRVDFVVQSWPRPVHVTGGFGDVAAEPARDRKRTVIRKGH
jgi:hypothetical protein